MLDKKVLVVGDVCTDIVFTGLAHIPRSEQDVLAQELEILVGGQAGTFARALSCLNVGVTFVGRVGNDDYGRMAVEQLGKDGVDVSGVVVDPCVRTGTTVVLSTGQERAFATYLGSISKVTRADVKREYLQGADHMHVGSYYLLKALHPEVKHLFEEARQLGVSVSVDPGWDSFEEWDPGIFDVLTRVDVFMPNEIEAMTITQTDTPEKALEVLGEYSAIVVIKMGAKGCLVKVKDEEETICCSAFDVPVVDVTSAGDIFNAGFIYAFLGGWDLRAAARFANACGAIAVTKVGSSGIISGVQEVEDLLASRSQQVALE